MTSLQMRNILALDFGGTKLSVALMDVSRPDFWLDRIRAQSTGDAQSNFKTMLGLSRQLLQGRTPAAVGVSFGGPVDSANGRVRLSHHIPGWEDFPLKNLLQDELGAPVVVENDANAAAFGEWRFGAGRGCNTLLYVTVSTGVGGGWVLEGEIYRGADGLAGEIGHIVVRPGGPLCTCGKRGCVEALASGPALAQSARRRLEANPQVGRLLRELVRDDLSGITAESVSRAAECGDRLARQVLRQAAYALGDGIGIALSLLNPQRVVIGGGVSKSGELYWQALKERVRVLVLPGVTVDLVPAALGDDAPLWGAVALAMGLLNEKGLEYRKFK